MEIHAYSLLHSFRLVQVGHTTTAQVNLMITSYCCTETAQSLQNVLRGNFATLSRYRVAISVPVPVLHRITPCPFPFLRGSRGRNDAHLYMELRLNLPNSSNYSDMVMLWCTHTHTHTHTHTRRATLQLISCNVVVSHWLGRRGYNSEQCLACCW